MHAVCRCGLCKIRAVVHHKACVVRIALRADLECDFVQLLRLAAFGAELYEHALRRRSLQRLADGARDALGMRSVRDQIQRVQAQLCFEPMTPASGLDALANKRFSMRPARNASRPASTAKRIARAMHRVLDRSPGELFLIEGHTDAVGSEIDNLSLSDRRAETVAIILTDEFGIPAENLTTQGYGEEYLKEMTDGPSWINRRVGVRRITPLLSREGWDDAG